MNTTQDMPSTTLTREELKALFQNGTILTEENFAALIDNLALITETTETTETTATPQQRINHLIIQGYDYDSTTGTYQNYDPNTPILDQDGTPKTPCGYHFIDTTHNLLNTFQIFYNNLSRTSPADDVMNFNLVSPETWHTSDMKTLTYDKDNPSASLEEINRHFLATGHAFGIYKVSNGYILTLENTGARYDPSTDILLYYTDVRDSALALLS